MEYKQLRPSVEKTLFLQSLSANEKESVFRCCTWNGKLRKFEAIPYEDTTTSNEAIEFTNILNFAFRAWMQSAAHLQKRTQQYHVDDISKKYRG